MRGILIKDLLLIERAGFRGVQVGYVLLLFLWIWSGTTGQELFGRSIIAVSAVSAILTPWMISRLLLNDRDDRLIQVIAETALEPWKMVLIKAVAGTIYLLQFLLLSLPIMALAFLLGATTTSTILWSYSDLLLFLLLIELITMHWSLREGNLLTSLVYSYASLALLGLGRYYLTVSFGESARLLLTLLLGLFVGWLLLYRSSHELVYLRE